MTYEVFFKIAEMVMVLFVVFLKVIDIMLYQGRFSTAVHCAYEKAKFTCIGKFPSFDRCISCITF